MRYSFEPIGTHEGSVVYRSIVARSDPIVTDEDFAGLTSRMNTCLGQRWIWVIDFKDMQMSHCLPISYIWQLYHLLHGDHQDWLQRIWIKNVNPWIQMILLLLASAKIDVLPSDRVELFLELQRRGCPVELSNHLLADALPAVC